MKILLLCSLVLIGTFCAYGQKPLTKVLAQRVLSDSSWQIGPRIQERTVSYIDHSGKKVVVTVVKAKLKKNKLMLEAATPDNKDEFGRRTVPDEMKAENGDGRDVIAGVNADFFNMKNGIPLGPVVKDQRVIKGVTKRMVAFVGVLNSGRVVLGDSILFKKEQYKLSEALGARPLLLRNGQLLAQDTGSLSEVHHPRTAFGIAGKNTIFLVTVDGRQPAFSNGISLTDLGKLLRWLGAEDAVNLDGGGSTTMIVSARRYYRQDQATQNAGKNEDDNYKVQNKPSGKILRPVANSWILVRKY